MLDFKAKCLFRFYHCKSMFLITTPIPYTNSEPHLGHLMEGVFNDSLARFYRRLRSDVILTMGLDQHGLKIYEKAIEMGQTPEVFVTEQGKKFTQLWDRFQVKYDSFVETASPEHKVVSQIVWKTLSKQDLIYKKSYTGLYCKGCEDFYAPSQLVDHKCPIHGTEPVEMSEENYFFRLSSKSDVVKEHLLKAEIRPEHTRKEWLNFISEDLQDISISREKSRLPWGVAIPEDDSQVMYVWFEALINYLTAVVNLETIDRWVELPQFRDETEIEILAEIKEALPIDILYASKEIAKFHLIIFPAILSGLGFELPKTSLAHGLINDASGKKFSKSLNNGVYPQQLVDKIGVDGVRFVLLHEINLFGDTDFDWKRILEAYNSHLADNIGNLLMRVTTLVEKLLDGQIELSSEVELEDGVADFDNLLNQAEDDEIDQVNLAGLILNTENKILICQKSEMDESKGGEWHFLDSPVKKDQGVFETIYRQTQTQLNLEVVKIEAVAPLQEDFIDQGNLKNRTHFFLLKTQGEISLSHQNQAFKFVDRQELEALILDQDVSKYLSLFDFAVSEGNSREKSAIKLFDFEPAYQELLNIDLRESLEIVLEGGRRGNEFLEQTKPWSLAKENKKEEVKLILTTLVNLLRDMSLILSIFMPDSGDLIYKQVTAERIKKAEILFPKVDIEELR
jgi:methionyl-tRNA synthetase